MLALNSWLVLEDYADRSENQFRYSSFLQDEPCWYAMVDASFWVWKVIIEVSAARATDGRSTTNCGSSYWWGATSALFILGSHVRTWVDQGFNWKQSSRQIIVDQWSQDFLFTYLYSLRKSGKQISLTLELSLRYEINVGARLERNYVKTKAC